MLVDMAQGITGQIVIGHKMAQAPTGTAGYHKKNPDGSRFGPGGHGGLASTPAKSTVDAERHAPFGSSNKPRVSSGQKPAPYAQRGF